MMFAYYNKIKDIYSKTIDQICLPGRGLCPQGQEQIRCYYPNL